MLAAGGLHIVGTERHESRRIDNQLRGRSGRQGDPGSSRFYLSMEDNLMRIFGDPNRTKRLLQMAGMKEGEVIESGMLTRQIEKAQRKVESHNFDIRKQLLLFDDVANDQRKVVYQQRTEIMGTEDLSRGRRRHPRGSRRHAARPVSCPRARRPRTGIWTGLPRPSRRTSTRASTPKALARSAGAGAGRGRRSATASSQPWHDVYEAKVARVGAPIMRHVEKDVMLRMLDQHWRDHLAAMDYLRQGIHLRGYAQKDYRYEYKREAFELFAAMLDRVKFETVSMLSKIEVRTQEEVDREEEERRAAPDARAAGAACGSGFACSSAVTAGDADGEAGAARRARGGSRGRRRGAARRRPMPRAPSCAATARSGATSLARAARARSSSTATARSRASSKPFDLEVCVARPRCTTRQGRVLIARAPAGQAHGRPLGISRRQDRGRRDETQALARELREELGMSCAAARPLLALHHDYADTRVELSMWVVEGYDGEPAGPRRPAVEMGRARTHCWTKTCSKPTGPSSKPCSASDVAESRPLAGTMPSEHPRLESAMASQPDLPEVKLDPTSLYQEEVFTDRRAGTIRRLTPITADGSPDPARATCCSPARRSC